jgi:hypothetical protein
MQTAAPCSNHGTHDGPQEDCTVIRYEVDGQIVWESHAHKDTHIACRIGDALPECVDNEGTTHRWEPMCDDCSEHFA